MVHICVTASPIVRWLIRDFPALNERLPQIVQQRIAVHERTWNGQWVNIVAEMCFLTLCTKYDGVSAHHTRPRAQADRKTHQQHIRPTIKLEPRTEATRQRLTLCRYSDRATGRQAQPRAHLGRPRTPARVACFSCSSFVNQLIDDGAPDLIYGVKTIEGDNVMLFDVMQCACQASRGQLTCHARRSRESLRHKILGRRRWPFSCFTGHPFATCRSTSVVLR